MNQQKANIIDYLYVFVKWRKFIILNFFVVCIVTAAVTLIMPKTYTAKTVLLPPTTDVQGLGISQILGNLSIGGMGFGGMSEETYTVMAIINSRTMMRNIINKFNLTERYRSKNIELTEKILRKRIRTEVNEDGTISLYSSVKTGFFPNDSQEAEARNLATEIANSFVRDVDIENIRIKSEKAKNTRIYIEKRYQENVDDLMTAENKLRDFQKKHGVIALPEQTAAAISAAAEIHAQVIEKQISISVLQQFFGSSHSELAKTKTELTELNKRLNEMKIGRIGDSDENQSVFFVPLNTVPDVGMEFIRLYRQVKLQEKLMEFLLPIYEQAKIEEFRDTPTLQVLDPAIPPIMRSSPKRGLTVVAMGLVSLLIAFLVVTLIEYLTPLKTTDEERYLKIERILSELRRDFLKFTRKTS